ncbi:MAG: TonB-dependent receptor, partial [Moraxellaceae bacterium]|nr:TonB-dependent receptor [Moraxellaceae bacterium]
TAMLIPLSVFAAEEQDVELQTIEVQATAIDPNPNAELGVPYKAKYSGDKRRTKPLAETPATVQVITAEAIKDSGYTDLRDILDSQPGITLGTGENGNAFGDRYIIRGQEARSDVFVDGLRDPGMTVRESFATEQVEISKGPNSSFAGRGTAGGAVNSITKQASLDHNFVKFSTGFGSDNHTRLTVDTNQALTDTIAIRANALYANEEVPGRDPADRERKGVALSTLFSPTDKLDFTLDYYGLRASGMWDMGGYLTGTIPNRKPVKNPPVYVQQQDFLGSDVDTITLRTKYDFNDKVSLNNLTRYGKTSNGYVVTSAGVATTGANIPGGSYATATLSKHTGWQEVDYLANQTNLLFNTTLAGMKHSFILGMEYSDQQVLGGNYQVTRSGQNCITGNGNVLNAFCIIDANGNTIQSVNSLEQNQITKNQWNKDWQVKTISTYIMDTVDLTDRWTVFAGLRHDRLNYSLETRDNNQVTTGDFDYSETLIDGHLGVTYKINDQGMVYLSYASASDVNGGESDVGTNAGYGGYIPVGADPEKSELWELGTKWNMLDQRLLLTAAVFNIKKSDVMEGQGYTATGTANSGANRVRGVELGLVGQITDRLTAQAGLAVMDAEVTKGVPRGTAPNQYPITGKTLSNFAEKSAVVQLKYALTNDLSIGSAAKYESERYAGQPDTAPSMNVDREYTQPIPSYVVYDLFANYRLNKNLDFRLNVGNISNKDYYLAG